MFRRIICFFVFFVIFALPCLANDVSELYLVKSVKKENLDNFVGAYFKEKNFNYVSNLGYLFVDENNFYRVVMAKQVGEDCYFYYLSDVDDKVLFKDILKRVKSSGLKVKKIKNEELKNVFQQDALIFKENQQLKLYSSDNLKSDLETFYDFSDEAQERFDTQIKEYSGLKNKGQKVISENKNVKLEQLHQTEIAIAADDAFAPNYDVSLKGEVTYIPENTVINAVLQSAISSQSISENDVVTATLDSDWIYDGKIIAPAGSILYGNVVSADKAGYAHDNGEIEITFKDLLTLDGQKFGLATNVVKFETGINRPVKIAARVISGALMGVVAGTAYALLSGGDIASGIAVGASIGGAGGAVAATAQKGQDVEVPAGAKLQIKLTESMNVATLYQ